MAQNRQLLIASLPRGPLAESNYTLQTVDAPEPGPGEVLCRTLALAITAGTRAGLQGSASYAGAPKAGIVMNGSAVARVEQSNDAGVPVDAMMVISPQTVPYVYQSASWLWTEGVKTIRANLVLDAPWYTTDREELVEQLRAVSWELLSRRQSGEAVVFDPFSTGR